MKHYNKWPDSLELPLSPPLTQIKCHLLWNDWSWLLPSLLNKVWFNLSSLLVTYGGRTRFISNIFLSKEINGNNWIVKVCAVSILLPQILWCEVLFAVKYLLKSGSCPDSIHERKNTLIMLLLGQPILSGPIGQKPMSTLRFSWSPKSETCLHVDGH